MGLEHLIHTIGASERLPDVDRRTFLQAVGAAACVYAAGCSAVDRYDPNTSPPEEFSIEKFHKWFVNEQIYSSKNPNYKGPGRQKGTFKSSLFYQGWVSPGFDYIVPRGTPVVAAADGHVLMIDNPRSKLGGDMIRITHPSNGRFQVTSGYAHLDGAVVRPNDRVKRGQTIGYAGGYRGVMKFMAKDSSTWVDPDQLGYHYGYMDYADATFSNPDKNREAYHFQSSAFIWNFLQECKARDEIPVLEWVHRKKQPKVGFVPWSDFERFKYLRTLYEVRPQFFPSITPEKMKALENEYYGNQQTVLSFPFNRPK
jgi:hypothetical protein